MRHNLDKITTAAGMRARGASWDDIGSTLGVNERTARRWAELQVFRAEVERVRSDLTPTPNGVYVMALTARRDDGIDWNARLRAADALISKEAVPTPDDKDDFDGWDE